MPQQNLVDDVRRRRRRRVETALRWACAILLVFMAVVTLAAAGVWTQEATRSAAKSRDPHRSGQIETAPPTAEIKAQIDAAIKSATKDLETQIEADRDAASKKIDAKLDDAKTLLNLLITLVGVYSVVIGATAFVTVKFARDDAKEQISTLRDAAAEQVGLLREDAKGQVDTLRENAATQINTVRDNAKEKIEELQERIAKIQEEFPEFGSLHDRVEGLVREMQQSMPSEADWNDDETFRALKEVERQAVLHNEMVITAMSVFALNRSPTARTRLSAIYGAFARFYLGRHNTSADGNEADYERALYYATLAMRDSDYDAGYLRLRGAIHLARYDRLKQATPRPTDDALERILKAAKADLKEAIAKDSAECVDGGAHYNLGVALEPV